MTTLLRYPLDVGSKKYENRRVTFTVTDKPTKRNKSLNSALQSAIRGESRGIYTDGDSDGMINALIEGKGLKTVVDTGAASSMQLAGKAMDKLNEWGVTGGFDDDMIEIGGGVQMCLPATINIDNQHKWSSETGIAKKLSTYGSKIASSIMGDKAAEAGITMFQYASMLKSGTQYSVDPSYWQLYNGSEPRTLTMSYNFLPLNQQEAEEVLKIIAFFKKYSSPALSSNKIIMKAPCFWSIELDSPQIGEVLNFDNCVITSVQTTIGDSAEIGVYRDGMPKFISMSLYFTETQPPYRNDTTKGEENSTTAPSSSTEDKKDEANVTTTSSSNNSKKGNKESENKTEVPKGTSTPYSPVASFAGGGTSAVAMANNLKANSSSSGPQTWGDMFSGVTNWFKSGVKKEAEEREQKRQEYMNELAKG